MSNQTNNTPSAKAPSAGAASISVEWKCARACVVRIDDGGTYASRAPWDIYLNGQFFLRTEQVVTYVDNLLPQTRYELRAISGQEELVTTFGTDAESFTLDVAAFGATGDGVHDDTGALQAAIMCCPAQGRVVVPAGTYKISGLFVKSNMALELREGAHLVLRHNRENLAYMPGEVEGSCGAGYAGTRWLPLGTWEGTSEQTYVSCINAIHVSNCAIYGRGVLDGDASYDEDNWWHEAKTIRGACRPRLIFMSECENIQVVGLTLKNSPSWNVHPVLSRNLAFMCMTLISPKVSPNTDGINPESSSDIAIVGCHFSVGDDCIAIKSGKLDKRRELRPVCENIRIEQCYMHDGHGSVVLGSEGAGGIRNVYAHDCLFERTDRGLRVKTRRGRGRDSVISNIVFEHITMHDVLTPFVVNSFYNCDPDGCSDYVQCREELPVDERTPKIESLAFRSIEADGCAAAASFITGLPESKIGRLEFSHVHVSFDPDAEPCEPAMACGVEKMAHRGYILQHVSDLVLVDTTVEGAAGDAFELEDVESTSSESPLQAEARLCLAPRAGDIPSK